MMIKLGGWFAATLLSLFWVASAAQATVICVQPQAGVCEGDIRSGLTRAAYGDTVRIRPGVYIDTVQLPPLKAGVRLIGSAGVIVVARSDGVPQAQPIPIPPNPVNPPVVPLNQSVGVHIYADDVQLIGFTVLGGISDGIFVQPGKHRARIVDVRIIRPAGIGVNAPASDGIALVDVSIESARGGVNIVGAAPVLDRLVVDGSDGPGVVLTGDDIFVAKTKISRVVNGRGIFVTGNRAHLDRPVLDSIGSTGIEVVGNDATVLGAKITGASGGIRVTGNAPWVVQNRIERIAGGNPGVAVTCTTCAGGRVADNRVEHTTGDSAGFVFLATGAGLLAEKNRAKDVADIGFQLTGSTGVELSNNRAELVGTATEDCFVIAGANHVVSGNLATRCARNGFTVTGTNQTLDSNTSNANRGDGIQVSANSTGAVLISNRTLSNAVHGIEVADGVPPATNTVLDSNRSKLNTVSDVCREGLGTTVIGKNKFGSELVLVQNGVRDCVQ